MSTAELASSYAALILADDGIEITVSLLPNPRSEFPFVAGRRVENFVPREKGDIKKKVVGECLCAKRQFSQPYRPTSSRP